MKSQSVKKPKMSRSVAVVWANAFFPVAFLLLLPVQHSGAKLLPMPNDVGLTPEEYASQYQKIMTMSSVSFEDLGLTDFFRHYASSFFLPTTSFPSADQPGRPFHPYHVQRDDPPGTNQVLARRPALVLEAMPVDFDSPEEAAEPLNHLHEEESVLRKDGKVQDLVIDKDVMFLTMKKVMNVPRNADTHPQDRESVGSYVYGRMGRMGLVTYMQRFQPRSAKFADQESSQPSSTTFGANIIGVLPGLHWATPYDRPLIIGAHWDTVPSTPGYNDNGSGVAAMLEIASTLARSSCFVANHSIIFAAFDLEEPGCHGSLEFIRSYLVPDFAELGVTIQGAVIIDTILNFDGDDNSQKVPASWKARAPDVAKSIADNDFRGDFVSLISRSKEVKEERLADVIKGFHARLGPERFRLEHFRLEGLPNDRMATVEELYDHADWWRSDNSRFWFYQDEKRFTSFGAVLLTDTASYRGYMHNCYHQTCDVASNPEISPDSLYFMAKTAQAVLLAAATLAEGIQTCDLKPLNLTPLKEEVSSEPVKETSTLKVEVTSEAPINVTHVNNETHGHVKPVGANQTDILSNLDYLGHDPELLMPLLGLHAALLLAAQQPISTRRQQQEEPQDGMPTHSNYGTQFNIGQVTVNVGAPTNLNMEKDGKNPFHAEGKDGSIPLDVSARQNGRKPNDGISQKSKGIIPQNDVKIHRGRHEAHSGSGIPYAIVLPESYDDEEEEDEPEEFDVGKSLADYLKRFSGLDRPTSKKESKQYKNSPMIIKLGV